MYIEVCLFIQSPFKVLPFYQSDSNLKTECTVNMKFIPRILNSTKKLSALLTRIKLVASLLDNRKIDTNYKQTTNLVFELICSVSLNKECGKKQHLQCKTATRSVC